MRKYALLLFLFLSLQSLYSKEIEKVEIYGRKFSQELEKGITPRRFKNWVTRIDTTETELIRINEELYADLYDEIVIGFYVTTTDPIFLDKIKESLASLTPIEVGYDWVDVKVYMRISYTDQTKDDCYLGYPNTQFKMKKYQTNWQLLELAYEKSPSEFKSNFLYIQKLYTEE